MPVMPQGIESLIGAGARIINLNELSEENLYIHEVLYEDHHFIAYGEKPYIYVIEKRLW